MEIEKLKLIGIGAAVLVVLYFIFSPYQNCVRSIPNASASAKFQCTKNTSW